MTTAAEAGADRAGVVIPVRSFRDAKRRLGSVLTDDEREALCRELAGRVRTAAGSLPVAVVSADPGVRDWAAATGCTVLDDPGSLDAAAECGIAWARTTGLARVVIAHADLPAVTSFEAVLTDGSDPVAVVVPDHRDDGTPVLSLPASAPFGFAYGPGSAARHVAAAEACGLAVRILRDPDLGFDIDVDDDLVTLEQRRVPR